MPADPIKLDYTPGEEGELAHITASEPRGWLSRTPILARTASTRRSQTRVGPHRTVKDERQRIVNVLPTDETCALSYHNWSQNGEVKEFAGFIVMVRSERPQRRLVRYWCRDTKAAAGSCD